MSDNDSHEITINGEGRIKSIDDLVDAMDIDIEEWDIKPLVVNVWENQTSGGGFLPLYQVKASLYPKANLGLAKEEILDEIREHSPKVAAIERPSWAKSGAVQGRYLLELGLTDVHLGMRTWPEISGNEYNLEDAEALFLGAVRELLARASHYPVDKILLPIGSDLLHIDTLDETTTKGTPQEVSAHLGELFRRGWKLMRAAIEECKKLAPVELISVPGNHDAAGTLYVSEVIFALYEQDDNVTVESTMRPRTYRKWGSTLLGWTHKPPRGEKLPIIMAQEASQEWAETTHREFHMGHFHRVKTDEVGGVRMRILPSLVPRDDYHTIKGYQNLQAAEAYLWEESTGYAGHISVSPSSIGV